MDTTFFYAPHTPTRKELALPTEGVVFCCFNNTWKISPSVFDVWMRLLKGVAGSVLWLRRDNPHAEANLRSEAAARGIDPSRVVFAGPLAYHGDHLARHRLADAEWTGQRASRRRMSTSPARSAAVMRLSAATD